MFHGGMGPPPHHRGGFGVDEDLGKVYDNRVVARLPKYLAPVKGWIALGVSGMVIRSLAMLAVPYLVGIGANYIFAGNLGALNLVVILFIVSLVALWGGMRLETLYLAYAGQSVILRMRTEMLDHLHRLSMSFFDRNQVGKLMSRVQNDVQQ